MERRIMREIFDLSRLITASQFGARLTTIQLRTMVFVKEKGIVKPTEIAKKFSITPASVTSQIDNLVEDGWLERIYNQDDKRVIEVKLTKKAEKELSKEIDKFESNCEWIFEPLTKEESDKLLELLKKLNKEPQE